jgi:hypothetical protein
VYSPAATVDAGVVAAAAGAAGREAGCEEDEEGVAMTLDGRLGGWGGGGGEGGVRAQVWPAKRQTSWPLRADNGPTCWPHGAFKILEQADHNQGWRCEFARTASSTTHIHIPS